MQIHLEAVTKGQILPLTYGSLHTQASHGVQAYALPSWPVGTRLMHAEQELFTVIGRTLMPAQAYANRADRADIHAHTKYVPLLQASTDIEHGQSVEVQTQRKDYALAYITLSDKGSQGQREDTSGPLIEDMVRRTLPLNHAQGFLLPDDGNQLRTLLWELALGQGYDIICTTGGTGLGPRDVTPEAMLACIDKRLYGFEQMMMAASLQKTPHAALSRAVVGTIGSCLCINLPGSRKAVQENLEAIVPALNHALQKIHGDSTDCGG